MRIGKKFIGALALLTAVVCLLTGCGPTGAPEASTPYGTAEPSHMELRYAEQFTVDYYDDGALITIGGTDRYFLVSEGSEPPEGLDADIVLIHRPIRGLYLAASSAMDHFIQLDALDQVCFTSTMLTNWGLPEVRTAMEDESIIYVGKYSAPDFEVLLSEGCGLTVESTMIYHSPETQEMLESLGIPVLVERSSYESHPLGRVEWIKLYGLLIGREAEAEAFFDEQVRLLEELDTLPAEGQTVAFFHINTVGAAVVRRPGDYVTKLIELAGGRYVFSELEDSSDGTMSTLTMQMEAFYTGARDADVLIYNSTIDGELETLDQLLQKSSLLADFKAVQNGNVWCTEHDMFQKSTAAAGMTADLNAILSGTDEDTLEFFHRLK